MGRGASLVAVGLVLGACSGSQHPVKERMSAREIVDKNKPAIVRIESEMPEGVGVGTGFIIRADGRIATNFHVIRGARKVTVRLLDGKTYRATKVVAADQDRDLAIIAIEKRNLPVISLGNSDDVEAGDRVIAIGNPLGVFDYTVSDGLISSRRQLGPHLSLLQISAPISQGSSGGPLFNPYGEVIGIAVAISQEGQNINFGVPSNYLRNLMKQQELAVSFEMFDKLSRQQAKADSDRLPWVGGGGGGEGGGGPTGGGEECQHPQIVRQVPNHAESVLDGCSNEQLAEVFVGIQRAIELGAPIYNRCQYEACFVIYRQVAEKFTADRSMCKGVREAFTQGMQRVDGTDGFATKAWALRDTFDGLLDVIARKVTHERQGAGG